MFSKKFAMEITQSFVMSEVMGLITIKKVFVSSSELVVLYSFAHYSIPISSLIQTDELKRDDTVNIMRMTIKVVMNYYTHSSDTVLGIHPSHMLIYKRDSEVR